MQSLVAYEDIYFSSFRSATDLFLCKELNGVLSSVMKVAFLIRYFCFFLLLAAATAIAAEEATLSHYRVNDGDVIRLVVFEEPDLSLEAKVDPEGIIIVPLLGRVQVGGKTAREIEEHLESRFIDEEYLIRPQISVTVTLYSSRVFYIFGEVNAPGAKPFPPGRQSIDILEAITMGGDLGQYARRKEIVLRRPNPDSGVETRIIIDLDRILRGDRRGREEVIEVRPQDIIFVPERLF